MSIRTRVNRLLKHAREKRLDVPSCAECRGKPGIVYTESQRLADGSTIPLGPQPVRCSCKRWPELIIQAVHPYVEGATP